MMSSSECPVAPGELWGTRRNSGELRETPLPQVLSEYFTAKCRKSEIEWPALAIICIVGRIIVLPCNICVVHANCGANCQFALRRLGGKLPICPTQIVGQIANLPCADWGANCQFALRRLWGKLPICPTQIVGQIANLPYADWGANCQFALRRLGGKLPICPTQIVGQIANLPCVWLRQRRAMVDQ